LVIKWIIACNQPFDEVENPGYIAMMSYGCDPSKFSLPKKDGVQQGAMKLERTQLQQPK
jgi:hypothetical protein